MKVMAVGMKDNKIVTVSAEWRANQWIYSIRPRSEKLLKEFKRTVADRHPIGGTYYPAKKEPTYIIAAMSGSWFFDNDNAVVEVDGEVEEMPFESGVVY